MKRHENKKKLIKKLGTVGYLMVHKTHMGNSRRINKKQEEYIERQTKWLKDTFQEYRDYER